MPTRDKTVQHCYELVLRKKKEKSKQKPEYNQAFRSMSFQETQGNGLC